MNSVGMQKDIGEISATATSTEETFYKNASPHNEEISLLPGTAGFDSITNVVLLIERCLEKQRKSASERRDAAEESQARKDAQAVSKIREEADDVFKQALVSGITQMASSAVKVGSAGMNLQATTLEASASKMKEAGEKGATELAQRAAHMSAESKALESGAAVLDGSGKLVDAPLAKQVKNDQAEQAEAKAAADAFGRAARREDETSNEANEMRKKTFDRLEQLLQSEQQSRLALIQRA